MSRKPLGRKAYGSIPHLPNSRMGPGDHACHGGQARIVTEKARDSRDLIVVQEKLDGSCVAVANVDGQIVALGRAGYEASTSPYEQHHMFAHWVRDNVARFKRALPSGQRFVGEWLAQAHGTQYDLHHEPFVPFDLMHDAERAPYDVVQRRATLAGLLTPALLSVGPPVSVAEAMARAQDGHGWHGSLDAIEGAVWRVERDGAVDFLVKYVRPDKVDGCYLPGVSGHEAVWHWTAWEPKAEVSA